MADSSSGALTVARATREELQQAMEEKATLAEQELASAKRMRHQAQVELSRAHAIREHAVQQVNSTLLQITCFRCRNMLLTIKSRCATI